MDLMRMCEIAGQGTVRVVLTYAGNGKYAAGFSDGHTTPIIKSCTPEEIDHIMDIELKGYKEKAKTEANKREEEEKKAIQEAKQHKAEQMLAAFEQRERDTAKKAAELRKNEEEKAKQNQQEFAFA